MFKKIALLLAFAVASTLSFGQNELVLSAVSSNSQPAPWSFTSVTFTLQNQSFATYSNVTVKFNINNNLRLKGGDEYTSSTGTLQDAWTNFPTWNIGNIGPSSEATITLNLFVLGSSAPSHVYGQVATAIGDPLFSTPGNGVCCTPNERDEAVFNLNGINPPSGGKPDMVINFWGTNPNPTQGGDGFANFRFKNIGTADVGSFFYSIFLSNDNSLSPDDHFIRGSRFDNGIPSGQTRNVGITFPLPANRSGQQYIIISIDPANEIDELNENNQIFFNSLFINPSGFKADLKVERFTTTPTPTQGGIASLDFRIINDGAVASGDFKYNVHISQDPIFNQFPQPDPQVISLQGVMNIPAGGFHDETISFQLPALFSGQYYALVLLDVLNEVDEVIENNNQGTYSLFINPTGGGIDLAPLLDDITDAEIIDDVNAWFATVDYRIINNGPTQSPSSSHGLYVSRDGNISPDDYYVGSFFTSILDPGASQNFSRQFTFPSSITGDLWLLAKADDDDDSVSEINENNNVQGIAFKTTVIPPSGGVDLELEMIQPTTPYNYAQWSFFEVPVKVTNRGTQAATGVEIEFRQTDLTTYKGGDEADVSQGDFYWWSDTWNIGTLQPNQSAIMTVKLFRLSPNSFVLYSEVTAMNETDIDSTPDNGVCCGAGEDDEDQWAVDGANADGVNDRSLIVENMGNQPFAIVNAMPNPVVDQFKLQVFSKEEKTSELTIVDQLGRTVQQMEVNLSKGSNTIPINISDVSAGLLSVSMTPFHPYLRQFSVLKVKE